MTITPKHRQYIAAALDDMDVYEALMLLADEVALLLSSITPDKRVQARADFDSSVAELLEIREGVL
jgi:hypothetical protein